MRPASPKVESMLRDMTDMWKFMAFISVARTGRAVICAFIPWLKDHNHAG